MMVRIAISGVTISGNMGGAAMLESVIEHFSARYPGAVFQLLSITPAEDRADPRKIPSGVQIVGAHYIPLLLLYLPLAIIAAPFSGFRWIRSMLSRSAYFSALVNADLLVDLSGIAFVDGRGLPLLAYNVACCYPASILGVPVFKMAQALGPFRTFLNRLLAGFVLHRCEQVIARGDITSGYLKEIAVPHDVAPDVAFTLSVSDFDRQNAARHMPARPEGSALRILLSPSEVARRLARRHGIDFVEQFVLLAITLVKAGHQVVLIPHSYGTGRSKNNDVDLAHQIQARLHEYPVPLASDISDPRVLRAMIGTADVFVGCRFHAVVAALTMAVPTVTIGWSHKYAEMVAAFAADRFVVPIELFNAQEVIGHIDAIVPQLDSLKTSLYQASEQTQHSAMRNFAGAYAMLDAKSLINDI
jgi:polysaccharide pyruvyl transferase WcaK-like protein